MPIKTIKDSTMSQTPKQLRLMGKKRGMTQVFDEKGNAIVCTVIEAEPNVITQIKTVEKDGYEAVQLGFEKVVVNDPRTMDKRVTKPIRGHYSKASVAPRRYLSESTTKNPNDYSLGQEIGVDTYADVPFVDICGMSKGKGFQGVMKLFNYAGGPASHGSGFHRHAGSTGMRSTPGRCLPGGPRASHMGDDRVTVQSLRVVSVRPESNVILVEGAVPGARNSLVFISPATKKTHTKKHNKK
jgi:large subunit ribosomal protein L3